MSLLVLHAQSANDLSLARQWKVLADGAGHEFAELFFRDAAIPRAMMAILVGAALGLSGSLFQQTLRNRLVSPMTLGVGSGAWLGMVCATVWAPAWLNAHAQLPAMMGGLAALGLTLSMAAGKAKNGARMVLSGLTVNLLLGAVTTVVVLFHQHYTSSLFVWGAGDLAQTSSQNARWLANNLWIMLPILLLSGRALTLLRLGSSAAQNVGLNVRLCIPVLLLAATWLCSVAITTVGLIGFIGLLAPNVARLLGARAAPDEMLFSLLLGATLLLGTDIAALYLSQWAGSLVPSGAVATLLGAPLLLWLAHRKLPANEQPPGAFSNDAPVRVSRRRVVMCVVLVPFLVLGSLCIGPGFHGWHIAWPSGLMWSLRWPGILASASVGAGLSIAGMFLQRLLRNPMASPDILGLSAGATLAVVVSVVVFGTAVQSASATAAALLGSLLVLVGLLWLGRPHGYSPAALALTGLSLGALLNAAVQLALAKGSNDSFALLHWMAGSSYAVSPYQATGLCAGVLLAMGIGIVCQRGLSIIAMGDSLATGLGLNTVHTRASLMTVAAALCAMATCALGPVTFLGLLAPHMARLLGAQRAVPQLLLSALIGALFMLVSDWLARVLIYPLALPVGIVASILCGGYFIYLLAVGGKQAHDA